MYKLVSGVLKIYYSIFYKVNIINKEAIINAKGLVIAGNHTSNHDPVLMYTFFENKIRFIAKEELFKIPFLKNIMEDANIIPVKRGSFDRNCINTSIENLKEGYNVGIFPEGTRSKTKDLKLGEGHNGVSLIASRGNANILPFAIIPKKHFKFFSEIKIVVGEEINVSVLKEAGYKHDQITKSVMKAIEELIEKER